MGFEIGDLGTHSSRKGVATMIAAGCTVSPPIISICIRAGWAMGGVKDKYLLYGCAGDQYVGRCASCLDQTTKEFAISPPYFDYSTLEGEEKIARHYGLVLREPLRRSMQGRTRGRMSFPGLHAITVWLEKV